MVESQMDAGALASMFNADNRIALVCGRKKYKKEWDKYKHTYCNIKSAYDNIKSMIKTLKMFGFKDDQIEVMKDPDSDEMESKMAYIRSKVKKARGKETFFIWFYYTGHIVTDSEGNVEFVLDEDEYLHVQKYLLKVMDLSNAYIFSIMDIYQDEKP